MQHPPDCARARLVRVSVEEGGGFGSKFQMLATHFAAAVRANYTVLTDAASDLGAYTRNADCAYNVSQRADGDGEARRGRSAAGGWACLFAPISACQDRVDQAQVPLWSKHMDSWEREDAIPAALQDVSADDGRGGRAKIDAMLWWGAVHLFLFQPNARTARHFANVAAELPWVRPSGPMDHAGTGSATSNAGDTPPPLVLRIGVHVRQGDKLKDTSGQITTFDHRPSSYLGQVQHVLRRVAARYVDAITAAREPLVGLAPHEQQANVWTPTPLQVCVFVATDSAAVKSAALDDWSRILNAEFGVTFPVRVLTARATTSVALEDNVRPIVDALQLGGSTSVGSGGSTSLGYGAALEILSDIHFLSQSHVHIGLCMSQPTRIAVVIGRARGTLLANVAMDYQARDMQDYMKLGRHERWRVPFAQDP